MKKSLQVRQGDVFLEQIDRPADLGTEVPREGEAVVLAYGKTSKRGEEYAPSIET